ncbi:MAG: gamma-butyrobetaine hydroxylase-like domain-containing protein [Gammaproteobacteria bacterium]
MSHPFPTEIRLQQRSRVLTVTFDDGVYFELPCELLRVYSPSADVKGHGPETAVLQLGKEAVTITAIEPVGQYAVRLVFDDGHDTGLYSWSYLYELGAQRERYWQQYLEALGRAGHRRQAP